MMKIRHLASCMVALLAAAATLVVPQSAMAVPVVQDSQDTQDSQQSSARSSGETQTQDVPAVSTQGDPPNPAGPLPPCAPTGPQTFNGVSWEIKQVGTECEMDFGGGDFLYHRTSPYGLYVYANNETQIPWIGQKITTPGFTDKSISEMVTKVKVTATLRTYDWAFANFTHATSIEGLDKVTLDNFYDSRYSSMTDSQDFSWSKAGRQFYHDYSLTELDLSGTTIVRHNSTWAYDAVFAGDTNLRRIRIGNNPFLKRVDRGYPSTWIPDATFTGLPLKWFRDAHTGHTTTSFANFKKKWYKEGTSTYKTPDTDGLPKNSTPVWWYREDAMPKSTSLSFDSNGGIGTIRKIQKQYIPAEGKGVAAKLPDATSGISRPGFDLLGWSKNRTDTVAQYQPGAEVTLPLDGVENQTLYAIWGKVTHVPAIDDVASTITVSGTLENPASSDTVVADMVKDGSESTPDGTTGKPADFASLTIPGGSTDGNWYAGFKASQFSDDVGDGADYLFRVHMVTSDHRKSGNAKIVKHIDLVPPGVVDTQASAEGISGKVMTSADNSKQNHRKAEAHATVTVKWQKSDGEPMAQDEVPDSHPAVNTTTGEFSQSWPSSAAPGDKAVVSAVDEVGNISRSATLVMPLSGVPAPVVTDVSVTTPTTGATPDATVTVNGTAADFVTGDTIAASVVPKDAADGTAGYTVPAGNVTVDAGGNWTATVPASALLGQTADSVGKGIEYTFRAKHLSGSNTSNFGKKNATVDVVAPGITDTQVNTTKVSGKVKTSVDGSAQTGLVAEAGHVTIKWQKADNSSLHADTTLDADTVTGAFSADWPSGAQHGDKALITVKDDTGNTSETTTLTRPRGIPTAPTVSSTVVITPTTGATSNGTVTFSGTVSGLESGDTVKADVVPKGTAGATPGTGPSSDVSVSGSDWTAEFPASAFASDTTGKGSDYTFRAWVETSESTKSSLAKLDKHIDLEAPWVSNEAGHAVVSKDGEVSGTVVSYDNETTRSGPVAESGDTVTLTWLEADGATPEPSVTVSHETTAADGTFSESWPTGVDAGDKVGIAVKDTTGNTSEMQVFSLTRTSTPPPSPSTPPSHGDGSPSTPPSGPGHDGGSSPSHGGGSSTPSGGPGQSGGSGHGGSGGDHSGSGSEGSGSGSGDSDHDGNHGGSGDQGSDHSGSHGGSGDENSGNHAGSGSNGSDHNGSGNEGSDGDGNGSGEGTSGSGSQNAGQHGASGDGHGSGDENSGNHDGSGRGGSGNHGSTNGDGSGSGPDGHGGVAGDGSGHGLGNGGSGVLGAGSADGSGSGKGAGSVSGQGSRSGANGGNSAVSSAEGSSKGAGVKGQSANASKDGSSSSSLVPTGSAVIAILAVALLLLVGGCVLVLVSKRHASRRD
ncbi:hypothetical protein [Bifidobacterium sp. ESL0745]|uniref:hypothetical protein n=1 Tax=Bifidobacterium sp. ESL0745 TaxID=2983226 RepID=UPI0023F83AC0|nr:hypothetical protein [Bifidobacterium sp. ESL0745]MDF7665834.1 hypothetical protein [Bifidobacterium sp. ESL0745]